VVKWNLSAARQPQGRPAARSDAIFDRVSEDIVRPDGRAYNKNA